MRHPRKFAYDIIEAVLIEANTSLSAQDIASLIPTCNHTCWHDDPKSIAMFLTAMVKMGRIQRTVTPYHNQYSVIVK